MGFFRLKFIYFQRMEDSFGKLRTDHGRLLEEVRELLGQIAGAEESLRGLHTAKSGLEEQIMEFDKRESEFQSTLSHMAAHHHQDKSALLQEWQVKNKDAANVMKELEHTEGEQKREILLLRDSIKELIERQNLFKKRTEIVIGELVAALKTKAALVEMTRYEYIWWHIQLSCPVQRFCYDARTLKERGASRKNMVHSWHWRIWCFLSGFETAIQGNHPMVHTWL